MLNIKVVLIQLGDESANVRDISKSETAISHETSGRVQAMFEATAGKTLEKPSGHFQKGFR